MEQNVGAVRAQAGWIDWGFYLCVSGSANVRAVGSFRVRGLSGVPCAARDDVASAGRVQGELAEAGLVEAASTMGIPGVEDRVAAADRVLRVARPRVCASFGRSGLG